MGCLRPEPFRAIGAQRFGDDRLRQGARRIVRTRPTAFVRRLQQRLSRRGQRWRRIRIDLAGERVGESIRTRRFCDCLFFPRSQSCDIEVSEPLFSVHRTHGEQGFDIDDDAGSVMPATPQDQCPPGSFARCGNP